MLPILVLLLLGLFIVYLVDHPIIQSYILVVMFVGAAVWYLFSPEELSFSSEELRMQMCLPKEDSQVQ